MRTGTHYISGASCETVGHKTPITAIAVCLANTAREAFKDDVNICISSSNLWQLLYRLRATSGVQQQQ